MKSSILATIFGLLATICTALPTIKRSSTYAIQVTSNTAFCSFLPPNPGDDVAGSENDGIPFCTDASLGGQEFPTGFIKTAHYAEGSGFSQVTGTIDRTAYDLSASDEGGQFDNRDIQGTKCNGYDYFVNLIEPDGETFCIRCCQDQSDCNLGISQRGCESIVPGDYS